MPDLIEDQKKTLDKINAPNSAAQTRYNQRRHYREYYDGKHETQLTERQRKYLQIKTGQEFNDNYCPIPVDALSEKLTVTGFTVNIPEDDTGEAGHEQAEQLNDWWESSRMDAGQGDVHAAAIRDSDAYVLVEWNNDEARPEITFEPAYDGAEGTEVVYDENKRRKPLYAFKIWTTEEGKRLNVYYLDRVEKYSKEEESDWTLTETQSWPVEVGVPVFHFRNRSDGYNYGKSELHDVIPLQNALNKSIIDMVAAADTTGFRLYWMTGDDPSDVEVVPGSWIYSDNENARVGHIPGEDLSKLIEFKDSFALEIARVSRTPLSFFQITGQVSSEGTLKQQESGLVSRAKKRQVEFGNTWEDVMKFCRKLWNLYGSEPMMNEDATLDCEWQDPETRDDLGRLQEAKIKIDLGIPEEQVWAEIGYDARQIEKFKESPDYQTKDQQRKYGAIGAAVNAGISPEAALREHGMNEEDINKALYEGQPEQ